MQNEKILEEALKDKKLREYLPSWKVKLLRAAVKEDKKRKEGKENE